MASESEPVRILIAPDKFKGSLEAPEVATAVARGLLRVRPDARVEPCPVADGGEGTVDAAVGSGFTPVRASVTGPLGADVEAAFAVRDRTAVIEMATASGLGVLPVGADGRTGRDALRASSGGTGELVVAALDAGCTEVVLGVGGSASTDGGAGLLVALGARLRDADGRPVNPGGAGLLGLEQVDLSGLDARLRGTRFVLAADVTNPLLGPHGAAAVFGPQKGADADDVVVLEQGLRRFSDRVAAALGVEPGPLVAAEGAGAAGGVGFAALAVLGAERRPGIDVVLDLVRLEERLAAVDVVITGEGSLDAQSLGGKTPIGVARRARAHGVPTVLAVCGRSRITSEEAALAGFTEVLALADLEPDPVRSMAHAAPLLEAVGVDIGRRLLPRRRAGGLGGAR